MLGFLAVSLAGMVPHGAMMVGASVEEEELEFIATGMATSILGKVPPFKKSCLLNPGKRRRKIKSICSLRRKTL